MTRSLISDFSDDSNEPGSPSDPEVHSRRTASNGMEPNPIFADVTAVVSSHLDKHAKKLQQRLGHVGEMKERVVIAHQRARHAGGHQRQAAADAFVTRCRLASHDPRGGIDHGRRMSRWLAYFVTAACVLLLWQVDSALLTVLLLAMWTTRMVTLVIVLASAASAHVAGKIHRREHDFDVPELEMSQRERHIGRAAAVAGVTVEVALGLIRTVKTGAVLTSVMLVAAGLALWMAVAWVAFRSHSDLVDDVERGNRALGRSTRRAIANIAAADKATTAYWAARDDLRQFAGSTVGRCASLIEKGRGLWAREHPGRPAPPFDEPMVLAEWHRFAAGEVPVAYEVGVLSAPVLHVADDFHAPLYDTPGIPTNSEPRQPPPPILRLRAHDSD